MLSWKMFCLNVPRVDFKPYKSFIAQTKLVFLLCNANVNIINGSQNFVPLRLENTFLNSLYGVGVLSHSLSSTARTHAHTHTHTHQSQNFHHLLHNPSSNTQPTALLLKFTSTFLSTHPHMHCSELRVTVLTRQEART
jgi:hypothetical protein